MTHTACSTELVFHYFLHGAPDADRLAVSGLAARPPSTAEMSVHQEVYRALFEPLLGTGPTLPGVFFTPIDFYRLPGSPLRRMPRTAMAVDQLDPATSVLTWELDGERVRLPARQDALREAAAIWSDQLIRDRFGVDRHRLFWYVPQIGCFPSHPIAIPGPVERPVSTPRED